MSIFTKATSGNQNPLVKLLMILVAVIFVAPVEGAKWLNRKVYDGDFWDGFGAAVLGFASGVGSAIEAGSLLKAGHGFFIYVPCGVAAFAVTVAYLFPIVYLILIKPVWKLARKLCNAVNTFCRTRSEAICQGTVSALGYLPGSARAWKSVLAKADESWFISLQKATTHVSIACGSAYMGYSIYTFARTLATHGHIGALAYAVAGGVVGFLAFALVWTALAQFVIYGKTQGLAIVNGIASVVGTAVYFDHRFAVASLAAGTLAGIALYIAYFFPVVCLLLSNGFWTRVVKAVKPLVEKTYDDTQTPSTHLLHQTLNLVVLGYVVFVGINISAAIALPLWATVLSLLFVGLLSYTLIGAILDWEGGNYVVGALSAIATGSLTGLAYAHAGFIYGTYGAIAVGFLAAAAVFCLAFPLVFLAYNWVATRPCVSGATAFVSGLLVKAHDYAWKKFETLTDKCEQVYDFGYRKETPYETLVEQIANIALTVFGAYWLHVLTHGFATVLAVPAVVLGTLLVYLLGGKLLIHNRGIEPLGGIASLVAMILLGSAVKTLQPFGLTLAVPVALVFGCFSYFLFFPTVFIGVRYIADPLLTRWLLPVLAGVYGFAWKRFGKIWDGFVAVYNGVVKFLAPYFGRFFGFFASAWKALRDVWTSMFGHRS